MIILSSYVASASLLRPLSGQESAFLTHQCIPTTQHSASHIAEPQHLCLGAYVYVLKWRDQTKPFHFLFLVQERKERKPLPPQCRLKALRYLRAKLNIWYAPGFMELFLLLVSDAGWGPPFWVFYFHPIPWCQTIFDIETLLHQRREVGLLKCGLVPVLASMHAETSSLGDRCAICPKKLDL